MIIEPEIEMNVDDDESQENLQEEGDDEGRERWSILVTGTLLKEPNCPLKTGQISDFS